MGSGLKDWWNQPEHDGWSKPQGGFKSGRHRKNWKKAQARDAAEYEEGNQSFLGAATRSLFGLAGDGIEAGYNAAGEAIQGEERWNVGPDSEVWEDYENSGLSNAAAKRAATQDALAEYDARQAPTPPPPTAVAAPPPPAAAPPKPTGPSAEEIAKSTRQAEEKAASDKVLAGIRAENFAQAKVQREVDDEFGNNFVSERTGPLRPRLRPDPEREAQEKAQRAADLEFGSNFKPERNGPLRPRLRPDPNAPQPVQAPAQSAASAEEARIARNVQQRANAHAKSVARTARLNKNNPIPKPAPVKAQDDGIINQLKNWWGGS